MSTSTLAAKTVSRLEELDKLLPPEYLTLQQAGAIYSLMRKYDRPPTNVLEIGTFLGRGACMLAAMVEPWGGHVTTVDLPWTGTANKNFAKTSDQWKAELGIENLTIVRRSDGAEGWLHDYFRAAHKPLDLVYIDGGHTWLNVAAQFSMALAAVRHGGWLIFDDIESAGWPDVGDVWRHVVCPLIRPERRYVIGRQGFVMRD